MRIRAHPILEFKESRKIRFYFNGKEIVGQEGDSIASALYAAGVREFSRSLKYNRERGFFCGIGKCSSCLLRVDGVPNVRACITPLREGMQVEVQGRLPDPPSAKFEVGKKESIDVDILVVGGGPAGLCAAITSAERGANVLIVDENQRVGGQLIKQTHKFFGSKQEKAGVRGIKIAQELERELEKLGIDLMLGSTVIGYYEGHHRFGVVKKGLYEVNCSAAIIACGAMENMLLFPGNDLPGVCGAGAVQTLMNVYGVKPGKKVVMVGAGNVGLIVSYQLLQAGVEVERVVEASPTIGGYSVHAAKLRRCGVPILTSHSIKEAFGKGRVEGVTIVKLDKNWNEIEGTEETIECDTLCLAVGLTPSTKLLSQIGVEMEFIPEAGGYVALHNKEMRTTVEGIYVAGDCSGIEEGSTAMLEGKIAGLSASYYLGFKGGNIEKYLQELEKLRAGPFGEKARIAKMKIAKLMEKKK